MMVVAIINNFLIIGKLYRERIYNLDHNYIFLFRIRSKFLFIACYDPISNYLSSFIVNYFSFNQSTFLLLDFKFVIKIPPQMESGSADWFPMKMMVFASGGFVDFSSLQNELHCLRNLFRVNISFSMINFKFK